MVVDVTVVRVVVVRFAVVLVVVVVVDVVVAVVDAGRVVGCRVVVAVVGTGDGVFAASCCVPDEASGIGHAMSYAVAPMPLTMSRDCSELI